jgi:hypothetical protein
MNKAFNSAKRRYEQAYLKVFLRMPSALKFISTIPGIYQFISQDQITRL